MGISKSYSRSDVLSILESGAKIHIVTTVNGGDIIFLLPQDMVANLRNVIKEDFANIDIIDSEGNIIINNKPSK